MKTKPKKARYIIIDPDDQYIILDGVKSVIAHIKAGCEAQPKHVPGDYMVYELGNELVVTTDCRVTWKYSDVFEA